MENPHTRFTKTVENYIKYRPSYPKQIIRWMTGVLDLKWNSTVADIGSGTGKLTQLFLDNGNPTFAVEPNTAMREAAENLLSEYENFNSHNGSAESSDLPSNYIDFIVAGQAFHWFDIPKTVKEFKRIGKPETWVLLIWNKREHEPKAFMKEYGAFVEKYNTDLNKINANREEAEMFGQTFGKANYKCKTFPNSQKLDFEGLKGRYLSASYSLKKDHPKHEKAMEDLKIIFETNEKNGIIELSYQTVIYYGQLKQYS